MLAVFLINLELKTMFITNSDTLLMSVIVNLHFIQIYEYVYISYHDMPVMPSAPCCPPPPYDGYASPTLQSIADCLSGNTDYQDGKSGMG